MTARIDPAKRKRAPQDDMSVKPRRRNPATQAKALAALKAKGTPKSGGNVAVLAQQNPDRPLTDKQKQFVKEWAAGESILSASLRAGYADNGTMGYRLSKDPAILKVYHREKALYEQASQMTRQKVMDGFLEAADMARVQADPVALTGAWREVGKMCGYYEPIKRTLDINLSGSVTMKKLEALDDAALLRLIKGGEGDVLDVAFNEIDDDEGEDA
jgi:hypothetical protein